jgi:hypothetical protein
MSSPKANIIEIPLVRGIRQDLESALMINGGLTDAINVTFDKGARLVKRGGFVSAGTATYSAKGAAYANPAQRIGQGARGELLVFTDADSHLYLPSEDRMTNAGQSGSGMTSAIRAQVLSKFGVGADQAGTVLFSDCCAVTGHAGQTWFLIVYTTIDSSTSVVTTYYDLIDQVTGARAFSGSVANSGVTATIQCRCLSIGTVAFIFTAITNKVQYTKIDLSGATPSVAIVADLVTDGDGTSTIFDVDTTFGGFVLAYRRSANDVAVKTYDVTPTILHTYSGNWLNSTTAGSWETPVLGISGAGSAGERIFAAGFDPAHGPTTEFAAFASDLSAGTFAGLSFGVGDIAQITVQHATTAAGIVLCSPNHSVLPSDPRGHVIPVVLTGSLVATQITSFANHTIGSRIYRGTSDALFFFARFNDPSPSAPVANAQSHYLLVDLGTGTTINPQPIAHVASGLVPLIPDSNSSGGIGGIAPLATGGFLFAANTNLGASSLSGMQTGVWECQAFGPFRYLNTPAHGTLIVAGATPLSYDGQRLVELSFYSYPCVGAPSAVQSNTGGSMAPGDYGYSFTYEWTDAIGNRHQSDASPLVVVSTGTSTTNTNKFTWTLPTLHATRKQRSIFGGGIDANSPVRIIPYRTAANDTGGVLHKTGAFVACATGSAAALTLVDGNSDAAFILGTDTAASVNTTVNKTLLIRDTATHAYSSITVTSGAATAKTTIVTDLTAGFLSAGLALTAVIAGTNQIKITTTAGYIDIDTVAHGSNLNTAVGFPAGNTIVNGQVSVNEILYTGGQGKGKLASSAPPPSLLMCVHGGRLWGLDAEDPERIWCTKLFETGEAPGYNPALQVLIPGVVKINGIGGQDDKLYAFGLGGTYIASYGDGPDNTGANGTFVNPIFMTADAACDDPRGVLTGTSGIYFTGQDQQSTTIYLLGRGASSPQTIGKRLRATLASYPICRGVVDRHEKARAEFLFVDSETNPNANTLVYYHYDLPDEEQLGQWTRAPFVGGAGSLNCLGEWDLSGNGRRTSVVGGATTLAYQSDAATTDPGTTAIAYVFSTGDIRPNGIMGWGDAYSVNVLATSQSADDFTLSASYDGGLSFETTDFSVPETSGPMLRRWESPTKKLPNGAVAYTIAENTGAAGNVRGCAFHALVLEGVTLDGIVRLPAGKKM